jgi:hypothetical protein
MANNPLKYIDPTGHKACENIELGGKCAPDETWQKNKSGNLSQSWEEDPDYDPNSQSISTWGDNWENTYMERAGKVWRWMCKSEGWWGRGCPKPYDLTVWLLDHEAGEMLRGENYYGNAIRAAQLIVTYTLYLFSDGIDAKADLGKYTSFYNTDSASPSYNSEDWKQLTTKPTNAAYNTVDAFKEFANPYLGYDLVWWGPADTHAPAYTVFLFTVTQVNLNFALK